MAWNVDFYVTESGRSPIMEFIDSLPDKVQGKCLKYIELLEERGLLLPANYISHIEDDLWELRPEYGGIEYRFLFYAPNSPTPTEFIIVHAIIKKRPKLKRADIEKALERIKELINR